MNVLVLNCGSSSVKFQLIATDLERIEQDADKRLAHGLIERIGGAGIVTFTAEGKAPKRFAEPVRDTRAAVEMILRWAISQESGSRRSTVLPIFTRWVIAWSTAASSSLNRRLLATRYCEVLKTALSSRRCTTRQTFRASSRLVRH